MSRTPKKSLNEMKAAFGRFWKRSGINHLIGLVVIMALILWFAVGGRLMFSWPVWVVIVLVLWLIRLWLEFRRFLREEDDDEKKS